MRIDELIRVMEILDESVDWEPDVLERMPKLFLLIRENYLRALSQLAERREIGSLA